jgi:hypothetical protein
MAALRMERWAANFMCRLDLYKFGGKVDSSYL